MGKYWPHIAKAPYLVILWLGMIAFTAVALFPPWLLKYASVGRRFLWNPPANICRIDFERLFAEWVFIAVATGVMLITVKDRKSKDE